MLRLLLTFLLLVGAAVATPASEKALKEADTLLKSSAKTDIFRAYNDYKNLYLKALMDNDDDLRRKALKGIVASGDKLHIDIEKYRKELASSTSRPAVKTATKHVAKQGVTKQKLSVSGRHNLESARWADNRIVLTFNKRLGKKQVNYFKLYDKKAKRYRYVFDVADALLDKSHTLRHSEIKRIKLAQFDQKTVRMVLENDEQLKIRFKLDGERLVINPNVSSVVSPVASKPLVSGKGKVIVIDPGHGGKDPGSVGYKKYREKVVVMGVAKELSDILKARGYKVYMTRSKDVFVKLRNRTKFANRKHADLFISIHANAVPKKNAKKAYGIETYFLSPARSERATRVAATENSDDIEAMNYYGKQSFLNFLNTEKIIASNKLAIDLQKGMLSELRKHYKKVKDGGVREGPFWVLVGAQMPAVLVEVGFITHPTEARRMVKKVYHERVAKGLANGVERYFANNR